MEQEKVKETKADDADEDCSLCAIANAKKKGSKCWWHMPDADIG
jgi:hypothetical protein